MILTGETAVWGDKPVQAHFVHTDKSGTESGPRRWNRKPEENIPNMGPGRM
jgi:hypothetical protein